jgi:signal transduction histidine kinase
VSEDTRVPVRTWLNQGLRQAVAFARSAEPRVSPSRRALATDAVIAAVALALSLILVRHYGAGFSGLLKHALVAALFTSVPLAARRWFPLTAFWVLLLGAIVTRKYATDVTFLAIIFAGYSAVAYSRFRGAALLSMFPAALLVTVAFWSAGPQDMTASPISVSGLPAPGAPPPPALRLHGLVVATPAAPWRLAGLVVAASLILIAVLATAVQARDRIRRLQAEHEAATRRALEAERARIAGELHDVVTHNVSVMIVQAGAARQVLTESPAEARDALLAVEASGRAAMTELRHLLGLLSPAQEPTEDPSPGGEELRPQPGLGQLRPLIERVAAAGLPVELRVGGVPRSLSPGLDLAAFRVVQEALTNVIKHAGKPRTTVTLDYRADDLVVEVADVGRVIPAAAPAVTTAPGAGRGLLGLRERVTLYGGELEAGPRPGGGWLVRARIPVDPLPPGIPGPAPATVAGPAPSPAAPAPAATSRPFPAAGYR